MEELTTLITDKFGQLEETSKEAMKAEREHTDYIEILQEQAYESLYGYR